MAIRVRLLSGVGIALAVVRGPVSFPDLTGLLLVSGDARYRLLLDVRKVDGHSITADHIRQLAGFGSTGSRRFERIAIVVPNDLAYGFARMFRAYSARHDDRTLRITRDAGEAWAWLRSGQAS